MPHPVSTYLFISPSIYLPINPLLHLSIKHLSITPSIYLSYLAVAIVKVRIRRPLVAMRAKTTRLRRIIQTRRAAGERGRA